MDGQRFDDLSRALAARGSRRQALRRLGGGLAGGALAALGLRTAVRAQDEGASPGCAQCIAGFLGECVATCARSSPGDQSLCPNACCEGSLVACTVLGECTAEETFQCPPPGGGG